VLILSKIPTGPKANQDRIIPEPKSNQKRTALPNQTLKVNQKRIKSGSNPNRTRTKSRKILASACKFALAKTENRDLARIKRTNRPRFLESVVDGHNPTSNTQSTHHNSPA
jgi:hypothetical protein